MPNDARIPLPEKMYGRYEYMAANTLNWLTVILLGCVITFRLGANAHKNEKRELKGCRS